MVSFEELVQDLPPELFYEIKHLVFTFNSARVMIDEHYKPPSQLHISAQIRSQFAEVFYSKTVFEFNQSSTFYKWLGSLTKAHLEMIGGIELQVQIPPHPTRHISQDITENFSTSWNWHAWAREVSLLILKSRLQALEPKIQDELIRMVAVSSNHAATPADWSENSWDVSWDANGEFL
jgi:hypothetical protein